MIVPLFLLLMKEINNKPHPSGKTFCQRHLVDDDPYDYLTRKFKEEELKKKQQEEQGEDDDKLDEQ